MLNTYEDLMPRSAPKPTPPIEVAAVPSVPEVSLLFDVNKFKTAGIQLPPPLSMSTENTCQPGHVQTKFGYSEPGLLQRNQFESYNTWKARNAEVLQNIAGSAARVEPKSKHIRPHVNGVIRKQQLEPPVNGPADTAFQWREDQFREKTGTVPQRVPAQVERCPTATATVPERFENQVQVERCVTEGVPQRAMAMANNVGTVDSAESRFNLKKSDLNDKYSKNQLSPEQLDREVRRCIKAYHAEMIASKNVQTDKCTTEGFPQRDNPQAEPNNVAGSTESQSKLSESDTNGRNSENQFSPDQLDREVRRRIEAYFAETMADRHLPMERYMTKDIPQRYEPKAVLNNVGTVDSTVSQFKPSKSDKNDRDSKIQWSPDQLDREVRRRIEEYHAEMMAGRNDRNQAYFEGDSHRQGELSSKQSCNEYVCYAPQPQRPVCTCHNVTVPAPALAPVSDLYNIIHLQNEQIILLQQQVKQVLQAHGKGQRQCDCPCRSGSGKAAAVRSVGVMTSPQEPVRHGKQRTKLPKRAQHKSSTPAVATRQQQQANNFRGRGKGKVVADESQLAVVGSADDSFSLDEAQLVVGMRPRAETPDPDTSLHIQLHDYCSSCDSASGSGSEIYLSDGEAEGDEDRAEAEKGSSEEASSEQQLGWTFYNQVVGQVNNILKKPGKRPDWDTWDDNNWSKRVTFNGDSPPGDLRNRRSHRPHRGQQQRHQHKAGVDYSVDYSHTLLYNSNLSFSQLRYLQRYNLLPEHLLNELNDHRPSRQRQRQGQVRAAAGERERARGHRRDGPPHSSKLLDLTALKRQPKLF